MSELLKIQRRCAIGERLVRHLEWCADRRRRGLPVVTFVEMERWRQIVCPC
jgi:hypothetical protein